MVWFPSSCMLYYRYLVSTPSTMTELLFTEVNSMVDEVRQIKGKVLEISRLQEIFTENR